jgi:hypothetical protein
MSQTSAPAAPRVAAPRNQNLTASVTGQPQEPIAIYSAPNPGGAITMRALGSRGQHIPATKDHVEIRMYKREFHNPNELVPTDKYIHLFPHHLEALKNVIPELNAAIQSYTTEAKVPKFLKPISNDGLHVNVNVYCDQLLIHIRYYDRCYYEPSSIYPTKHGVTLKANEMAELENMLPELAAAIFP